MNYQRQIIDTLASRIRAQGLRVFIAERGTYGFYTNAEGSRIVSFQLNFTEAMFSGNYIAENAQMSGQGWQITDDKSPDFATLLNVSAPLWVGKIIRYKTLEDYLKMYGESSNYKEVV